MSKFTRHEVEVFLHYDSPDKEAILVAKTSDRPLKNEDKIWLPRSHISYRIKQTSAGKICLVCAPEWLLINKNLEDLV
jgi:hypothetical protein